MDFFQKNLKETVEAINKLIDNNVTIVNTKRIRRCNNIKSSNRSKINFIWRALKYLEDFGILSLNGITNPKTYKIIPSEKIDIDEFLYQNSKKE
ncbi:MAG: hypothetical protein ACFFDY_02405 [Candidatus Thorarchaeota archaeon]